MKLVTPNHVIADSFEIKRENKDRIIYKEINKSLTIWVEAVFNPEHYLVIYLNEVKQWNEPSSHLLTSNDSERIRLNIQTAYDLIGTKISFE